MEEPIDRNHRLGPGDVLEISVNDREELSRTVRLFVDGTFDYPLLGTVTASGLTVHELAARLTQELKRQLRQPEVFITLRGVYVAPLPDPVRVTILGAVKKPGTFEVESSATILEIIEKAEGAKPEADLEKVTVQGLRHRESLLVNVQRYRDGDPAAGYLGQEGDVIVVPEKPLRVLVLGEVEKPGELPIREGARLLSVYLQAGIAPNGDPARAQLIRRGDDGKLVTRNVNLREIMKGKERDNEPMRAGDALYIPHKKGGRSSVEYLGGLANPLWVLRTLFRF